MFFSPFVSQHTKALGGRYRVYIAPAHILLIKNGENGCWNVLFILSTVYSVPSFSGMKIESNACP